MGHLKPGDQAPDFNLESVNAGIVTLSQLRGKRILLAFGRYFGCPACQAEFDDLVAFSSSHPAITIVYVTQSSPESATTYLFGRNITFPVVPAPKVGDTYPIYDQYGAGKLGPVGLMKLISKGREARAKGKKHGAYEGVETQSPAQFIVSPDGKIQYANYGLFNPEVVGKIISEP